MVINIEQLANYTVITNFITFMVIAPLARRFPSQFYGVVILLVFNCIMYWAMDEMKSFNSAYPVMIERIWYQAFLFLDVCAVFIGFRVHLIHNMTISLLARCILLSFALLGFCQFVAEVGRLLIGYFWFHDLYRWIIPVINTSVALTALMAVSMLAFNNYFRKLQSKC